jgi:hypothetical protein
MTIKPGTSIRIGAKIASTFATPVACGANDKIECDSFDFNENAEQLRDVGIGSGLDMDSDAVRGATEPGGQISKVVRFNDAAMMLKALLFGADSVVSQNGTFAHSLVYEANRNQKFATVVREYSTGSLVEIASCTPTKLNLKWSKFPNYLKEQIDLVGNLMNFGPSTNTPATLNNLTTASSIRVIAQPSDKFRLNLQGGAALADSDVYEVTDAEFNLSYPVEFPDEMKNSAGNGQPIASGDAPLQADVTITVRGMDDKHFRLLINSQLNTQYKADFTITAPNIIANAIPYSLRVMLPCLIQVDDPKNTLSSPKQNSATFKFKSLVVTAAPPGMLQGYPHMIVVNDRSTSHLA